MSGVEAAASLFGSDDPASDPFGSLGGNNDVAGESVTDQTLQQSASGVSELFSQSDSNYGDFDVGGQGGGQDYSSWPATTSEGNAYNSQDYYQAPAASTNGYPSVQGSQLGYGALSLSELYG